MEDVETTSQALLLLNHDDESVRNSALSYLLAHREDPILFLHLGTIIQSRGPSAFSAASYLRSLLHLAPDDVISAFESGFPPILLDIFETADSQLVRQAAVLLGAFKMKCNKTLIPSLGLVLFRLLGFPDRRPAVFDIADEALRAGYNLGPEFADALPALLAEYPDEVLRTCDQMAPVFGSHFRETLLPLVFAAPTAYGSSIKHAVGIVHCLLADDPSAAFIDFVVWAIDSVDEAVVIEAVNVFLHYRQLVPDSLFPVLWRAIGRTDEVMEFSASSHCLALLFELLDAPEDRILRILLPVVHQSFLTHSEIPTALRVLSVLQCRLPDVDDAFRAVVNCLAVDYLLDAVSCMKMMAISHPILKVPSATILFPLLPSLELEQRRAVEHMLACIIDNAELPQDPCLPIVLTLWTNPNPAEVMPLFYLTGMLCAAVQQFDTADPGLHALLAIAEQALQTPEPGMAAAGYHLFSELVRKAPELFASILLCTEARTAALIQDAQLEDHTDVPWMFVFLSTVAELSPQHDVDLADFFTQAVRASARFLAVEAAVEIEGPAWYFVIQVLEAYPTAFSGVVLDPVVRGIVKMLDREDRGSEAALIFGHVARVIEIVIQRCQGVLSMDVLDSFWAYVVNGLSLSLENEHPTRKALAKSAMVMLRMGRSDVDAKTVEALWQIVADSPQSEEWIGFQEQLQELFGQAEPVIPADGAEEADLTGD